MKSFTGKTRGYLCAAGIREDAPYEPRDFHKWFKPHRQQVLPVLLRMTDFTDEEITHFIAEGDLKVGQTSFRQNVRVRLVPLGSKSQSESIKDNRVLLTDLAAASGMMCEMFISLGAANQHFSNFNRELLLAPPRVQVKSGSIEYTIGGGLFASGVGLIVASSAGLVGVPVVGIASGTVLASIGLIELALGWREKIASIRKVEEEARALRLEHDTVVLDQSKRLRELEIKAKELDLEMARARLEDQEETRSRTRTKMSYSSLIPREEIIIAAERAGFSEAYANYLLNRCLPTYLQLKKYFNDIYIVEEYRPDQPQVVEHSTESE